MRTALLLVAALSLLLVSPGAWARQSDEVAPLASSQIGVATFFEKPGQPHISNEIVRLIDATPAGQSIKMAYYTLRRSEIISALVRAKKRGVDVQLTLDGKNSNDRRLAVLFKNGFTRGLDVYFCNQSCLGSHPGSINHNKFALFSKLSDGRNNVVLQASANIYMRNLYYENAVVIPHDVVLYRVYEHFFRDMRSEARSNPELYSAVGTSGVAAYFFPIRSDGDDPVASLLNSVKCTPGASVRIAMAFFSDNRGALMKSLAGLKADGCKVEVITGVFHDANGALRWPSIGLHKMMRGENLMIAPHLHSKIALIDAQIKGDTSGVRRKIVLMGSHNYTPGSLKYNDEIMLALIRPDVYSAYLRHWSDIAAEAASSTGLDALRIYGVETIAKALNRSFHATMSYPVATDEMYAKLADSRILGVVPVDPQSKSRYSYSGGGNSSFEICAKLSTGASYCVTGKDGMATAYGSPPSGA